MPIRTVPPVICDRHKETMIRDEPRKLWRCPPDCSVVFTDEEMYYLLQDRPNVQTALVSEFYHLPGGRVA